MPLPEPEPGLVLSYSYLWNWQDDRGDHGGEKDRPCVIVLTVPNDDGDQTVVVVPITNRPPPAGRPAISIPTKVRMHLGFKSDPCWVVLDEVNRFVWPGPDLFQIPGRPGEFHYGFVPPKLFRSIRDGVVDAYRSRRLRTVSRTS